MSIHKMANQYIFHNSAVRDLKGASKSFPKHETRHVSEHKVCPLVIGSVSIVPPLCWLASFLST